MLDILNISTFVASGQMNTSKPITPRYEWGEI
jgi:hypothetical protein